MRMSIEIIDNTTGKAPSKELIEHIAKEYGLMEMNIDQFAITEDEHVVLIDDCGNCSYVDTERFNLGIDFCVVGDGNDD